MDGYRPVRAGQVTRVFSPVASPREDSDAKMLFSYDPNAIQRGINDARGKADVIEMRIEAAVARGDRIVGLGPKLRRVPVALKEASMGRAAVAAPWKRRTLSSTVSDCADRWPSAMKKHGGDRRMREYITQCRQANQRRLSDELTTSSPSVTELDEAELCRIPGSRREPDHVVYRRYRSLQDAILKEDSRGPVTRDRFMSKLSKLMQRDTQAARVTNEYCRRFGNLGIDHVSRVKAGSDTKLRGKVKAAASSKSLTTTVIPNRIRSLKGNKVRAKVVPEVEPSVKLRLERVRHSLLEVNTMLDIIKSDMRQVQSHVKKTGRPYIFM